MSKVLIAVAIIAVSCGLAACSDDNNNDLRATGTNVQANPANSSNASSENLVGNVQSQDQDQDQDQEQDQDQTIST